MISESNVNVMRHYKLILLISTIIIIMGMAIVGLFGLNLGIDFEAGTTIDIRVLDEAGNAVALSTEEARALYTEAGYDPPELRGGDAVTSKFPEQLTDAQVQEIVQVFEAAYGAGNITHEENTVDTAIARELGTRAMLAVAIACIGICIYVSIRFEWRFAIAAIASLLHDALIVIAIFAIFRLEVSLPFVAAVLTVIGYSINDTIVIFDRVRENLRFAKLKNFNDLVQLVNRSVLQTLVRSINTTLTVVVAALALLVLGSPGIFLFSLALLIGLASGAYSSVFIACAIWMLLKKNDLNRKPKPKLSNSSEPQL